MKENSNFFDKNSEIISKLILNKIFSLVETEIKRHETEEKIPLFCSNYLIEYYIRPLVSLSKFLLINKDIKSTYINDLLLDYTHLKHFNTWIEIKEPKNPIKERAMTSHLRLKRLDNDYDCEYINISENNNNFDEYKRIRFEKLDIQKFENVNLLKRCYSQNYTTANNFNVVQKNIKSNFNTKRKKKNNNNIMNNNKKDIKEKKDSKSQFSSNFKVYDIPNFKNIPFEEPKEYQKLRESYEKDKLKKLEELKKEKEKEKRRKLSIFNLNKKDFDSKKFTFDSNGQVIPYHPFKLELNSNELLESKSKISKSKIENNLPPIPLKEKKNTNKFVKNKKIEVKHHYKEFIENFKKKNPPITPAGSNFLIINPEIGVIIHEENKEKGGNMNFVSKYNKTSLQEYSKLISENKHKNISFQKTVNDSNKRKKNNLTISNNNNLNSSDNLLDFHSCTSQNNLNDNISLSNNRFIKNLNLLSINVSNDISNSLFSTRNNPLLNHSISTIYNDNTNANNYNDNINNYHEGRIFIKDTFYEFKKSLFENESDINDLTKNINNNNDNCNSQLSRNYSSTPVNLLKNIVNIKKKKKKKNNNNIFKIPIRNKILNEKNLSTFDTINNFNKQLIRNQSGFIKKKETHSLSKFKEISKGIEKEFGKNYINHRQRKNNKEKNKSYDNYLLPQIKKNKKI